jgi:hypothetical protein
LDWSNRAQDSARLDTVTISDPQHSLVVNVETTTRKLFTSWAAGIVDILVREEISTRARCATVRDCIAVIDHDRGIASTIILRGVLPTIPVSDVSRIRIQSRRETVMEASQNMANFMHPHSSIDIINIVIRHCIVWIVTNVDITETSIGIGLVDEEDKISCIHFTINQCGI